jgi:hypothetical protein
MSSFLIAWWAWLSTSGIPHAEVTGEAAGLQAARLESRGPFEHDSFRMTFSTNGPCTSLSSNFIGPRSCKEFASKCPCVRRNGTVARFCQRSYSLRATLLLITTEAVIRTMLVSLRTPDRWVEVMVLVSIRTRQLRHPECYGCCGVRCAADHGRWYPGDWRHQGNKNESFNEPKSWTDFSVETCHPDEVVSVAGTEAFGLSVYACDWEEAVRTKISIPYSSPADRDTIPTHGSLLAAVA